MARKTITAPENLCLALAAPRSLSPSIAKPKNAAGSKIELPFVYHIEPGDHRIRRQEMEQNHRMPKPSQGLFLRLSRPVIMNDESKTASVPSLSDQEDNTGRSGSMFRRLIRKKREMR